MQRLQQGHWTQGLGAGGVACQPQISRRRQERLWRRVDANETRDRAEPRFVDTTTICYVNLGPGDFRGQGQWSMAGQNADELRNLNVRWYVKPTLSC